MAVTATTTTTTTTMLAAVAAVFVFLTLLLCSYTIFLRANKRRYRYRASGARARPAGGGATAADTERCDGGGGLDGRAMARLPRREVGEGEALDDCAVCIAELAPGDAARVLPRCGHGFHAACVDAWLRSRPTCPLCRRPAVDDDDPPAPAPVPVPTDPEAPSSIPTNVLFFGSQDGVSTGRSQSQPQHHSAPASPPPAPRRRSTTPRGRAPPGCGG